MRLEGGMIVYGHVVVKRSCLLRLLLLINKGGMDRLVIRGKLLREHELAV
jgi:hypothetical protein